MVLFSFLPCPQKGELVCRQKKKAAWILAGPLKTWARVSCQMLQIPGSAGSTPAWVTSSLPTKAGLALCAGQKNSQTVSVKGVAKWQIPLLPSLREIPHIH